MPKPVCADGLYRILNRLSKIPGEPYKVGEPGPAIERQLTPSPQPITTTPVVLPIRQSQKPPQLAPKPGPPLPPKSKVAIALYDFTGERSTDLSFKQGDLITIISKTDNTDDWWKGSLQNKIGDFPANYVELK